MTAARALAIATVTLGIALAAVAVPGVAAASPLGLRFAATSGPVYAPGPNTAEFGSAIGVQIEASRRAGPRLEWFGVASFHDFNGSTFSELTLGFYQPLYLPPFEDEEPLRGYGFELGLRRPFALGPLDLFVESAAGVARSEQLRAGDSFFNDRRPDPLNPGQRFSASGAGPSLSIGAGGVLARNGRFGLVTGVSARWLPAIRVGGPIVPVRLGLVWPVEEHAGDGAGSSAAAGSASRGPRLRLGAGTAWMDAPANVWRRSIPAAGLSVGLEWPLARGFSLRLDGAQVLFRSTERVVLWQEADPFGNLISIYSPVAPHWTTTFLTTGLSASLPRGRWRPYVHAGAGLARTGGDDSSIVTIAYVPPGGPSLTPEYLSDHQGLGRPHTGVAWSGGAGLELALAPTWDVFLEGTMLGVNLDAPDVQVFALRTGVVLR